MSNSPVNIGGVGTSGTRGNPSDFDNALQLFWGNVLKAVEANNVFLNLVTHKSISQGKSVSIPVFGQFKQSDIKSYTSGVDMENSQLDIKQRIINVDSAQYQNFSIDDVEQAIMHFQTRNQIASEVGASLSKKIDTAIAEQIFLASTLSGKIGNSQVQQDGTSIINGAIATSTSATGKGDALIESLFEARANAQVKDVNSEMVCVVNPKVFSYLAQSKAINRDFNADSNGLAKGQVLQLADMKIMMSNHLPKTGTVTTKAYNVAALVFSKEAVAYVERIGITSETVRAERTLETIFKNYYMSGIGVLNPAHATSILSNTA